MKIFSGFTWEGPPIIKAAFLYAFFMFWFFTSCIPTSDPALLNHTSTTKATKTTSVSTSPRPSSIPLPSSISGSASTSNIPSITGNLWNQVDRLESNMPRPDSSGFVVPSDLEKSTFSEIATLIEGGDALQAKEIAALNYFDLYQYFDRKDENASSYMLREMTPIQKGWGLYLFRIDLPNNVIVEAPHPLADEDTSHIAMLIYRALDARALLIGGTHRDANKDDSADITHTTQTVFQAIHETLAASGNPSVLQIHGFSTWKHPDCPQVVIGFNLGKPEDAQSSELQIQESRVQVLLKHLEEGFNIEGISVGICDGKSWQDLCGEKNVQSLAMDGGIFIHLELNEKIRSRHVNDVISALVYAFNK